MKQDKREYAENVVWNAADQGDDLADDIKELFGVRWCSELAKALESATDKLMLEALSLVETS